MADFHVKHICSVVVICYTQNMTAGTFSDGKLQNLDYKNDIDVYNAKVDASQEKTHTDDKNIVKNYYDETVPRNDFKFLAPIRKWEKEMGFVTAIRWENIFFISLLHIIGIISPLYIIYMQKMSIKIFIYAYLWGQIAGFGVTAGAHRYWTHRSYEAKLPFQILLMFCFAVAGQNTIYEWVRDHRVHHKMSETAADPHDVRRGFFFSHVGWLMMKKHPHVIKEGKKVYMDDIVNDPLIQIYTRYFILCKVLCCFIVPIAIPVYAWGEEWNISILTSLTRYMLSLNFTWSVNSFAHIWGSKPYDEHIMPVENWAVSMVAMGEGWHNYHHTFPWDYKAAELAYFINGTTVVLDGFSLIGWVYNRKQASPSTIQSTIKKNRAISNIEKHDNT